MTRLQDATSRRPWPFGFSTGCFYRRPILDVLEPIRDHGFREVEICSFPAHLDYHRTDDVRRAAAGLRAAGLRPFSFHAPFADHIDITSPDRVAREAAVAELLAACEAAALIGAEHIVLHPGPEREGRPPEAEFLERMHRAAESLNRVARRCCELGPRLLLENMLPHLLFGHTSDMMFLLGEIRECTVGTCLDTGHAFLSGDLPTVFHKLAGHLRMLHVSDNDGNFDAHLPPGEGNIDWAWVIEQLRRFRFEGALILELSSRPDEPVAEMLARAVRSREFLEGLVGVMG